MFSFTCQAGELVRQLRVRQWMAGLISLTLDEVRRL